MTANRAERIAFLSGEYAAYRVAKGRGETAKAWHHLERAHIVAQPLAIEHLRSHAIMLRYAINLRDPREAGGQMLRFGLALIGNLFGQLPAGNTGRARISAFSPMPVPPDLEDLVQGVRR